MKKISMQCQNRKRFFACVPGVFCWACLSIFGLFPGASSVWAQNASSTRHVVTQGDTIRALLLENSCVRSMAQYTAQREAFARLNPQIHCSENLSLGTTIFLPPAASSEEGSCLKPALVHLVRVEHEMLPTLEKVRMYLDGPVLPDAFLLKKTTPWRLVCDFDNTLPRQGMQREIACNGRLVAKIRIGHEDKPFRRARVVVEMTEGMAGRVEQVFFERESLFELSIYESFAQ